MWQKIITENEPADSTMVRTLLSRLFLNIGHSLPLLLYFYHSYFNEQLVDKILHMLDLSRGSLVSEVTALPSEPQPLPLSDDFFCPDESDSRLTDHNFQLTPKKILPHLFSSFNPSRLKITLGFFILF